MKLINKILEIRTLATLYSFATNAPSFAVIDGGILTCSFDSLDENCAWYTIAFDNIKKIESFNNDNDILALNNQNAIGFQRARFESLFDLERFSCTSERSFVFGLF